MRQLYPLVYGFTLLSVIACSDSNTTPDAGEFDDAATRDANVIISDANVITPDGMVDAMAPDAAFVNTPPVAVDDTATTVEDTSLAITAADLATNDTDVDGHSLTVTGVSNPTNGTVTLTTGVIDFVPTADFFGDATFDYDISDGNGGTDTGTVTVSVTADFDTVAPQQINTMAVACSTARPMTGRKVTFDVDRNIYAAMICGTDVHIVVSTDLGETFGTPVIVTVGEAIDDAAVQGGPSGVAYLAVTTDAGELQFARTADTGATWGTLTTIDTEHSGNGASMVSNGDSIYIAIEVNPIVPTIFGGGADELRVLRNAAAGVGAFASTDVTLESAYFDIVRDELTGDFWVASDTPELHLRRSTDGTVTFMPEISPPPAGDAFYSDWAAGNGVLYVSATGGKGAGGPGGGGGGPTVHLAAITLTTPGTLQLITGLAVASTRAVSADAAGNAWVATSTGAGAVSLDRALFGSTAIDNTVQVDAVGTQAGLVALPGNTSAAVIYTKGSDVYISVQTF